MLKVEFWDKESIKNEDYIYAVIVTRYKGQWIFVRHKERDTWEFPGGRREDGEMIEDTAKRELHEETGASLFDIETICSYSVTSGEEKSYGLLSFAEAKSFDEELIYEIAEIKGFDALPETMTYPEIIPVLFNKVQSYLEIL